MDEDFKRVTLISQVKDVFPDYGEGFINACLVEFNDNVETVIHRILENSLPQELDKLDRFMARYGIINIVSVHSDEFLGHYHLDSLQNYQHPCLKKVHFTIGKISLTMTNLTFSLVILSISLESVEEEESMHYLLFMLELILNYSI
jgi:hypothetical protein